MRAEAKSVEELAAQLVAIGEPDAPALHVHRDRLFVELLTRLRPRIRHLIRRYGLWDMREDAEQVCAIGVFRAIASFDAGQARFSTHVTWQLRGELQGLRHRVRLDQRQSARSAGISTISLDALMIETDNVSSGWQFPDEEAERATEAQAGEHLAIRALNRLMERIGSPRDERTIVLENLFERDEGNRRHGKTREQRRQIVRRTYRNCAKLLAAQPMAA